MAGRPEFQPTDEMRLRVRMMVATGVLHDEIAAILEIAPKTLRKHFRREIDLGRTVAHTNVATRLYSMAMTSDNPTWAIFWLKCQAGWKDQTRIEHTGADGAPLLTLADLDRIVQDKEI